MDFEPKTQMPGKLNISEVVVEQVARQTTLEVEGVSALSPLPLVVKDYILRAHRPSAIKIEINDGTARISIGLELQYGVQVERVAQAVQREVKAAVQSMIGLTVSKVNVFIMGLAQTSFGEE